MATLTKEQIEQKVLAYKEKLAEVRSLYLELEEAGAIELSDEDLSSAAGGCRQPPYGDVPNTQNGTVTLFPPND
jgi:hypothetical protein